MEKSNGKQPPAGQRQKVAHKWPDNQGWPFTLRWGCGAELRKLAQWFLPPGGWQFLLKNEMQKLDIFQVASNGSLVAETGVRKKSISMQKLRL